MKPMAPIILSVFLGIATSASSQEKVIIDLLAHSGMDRDVRWLQNFADGQWVEGRDLSLLDDTRYGAKVLSLSEIGYGLLIVKHERRHWRGLAIFLRAHRYENVKPIWDALETESRKTGDYTRVFRIAAKLKSDGVVEYETTTIVRLHQAARKLKPTLEPPPQKVDR